MFVGRIVDFSEIKKFLNLKTKFMNSKLLLVLLSISFFLMSCDKTLKKIDSESKIFKDEQEKKWASNDKLNKDTAFIKLLSSDKSLQDLFFKNDEKAKQEFLKTSRFTGPMDIGLAHRYSIEYQTFYATPESRPTPAGLKSVPATKSLWIDKKAIYTFVQTFLSNSDLDGIRVYFAKYNIDASERDALVNPENNGRNTVFFVVTQKDPTDPTKHTDFYKPSPTNRRTDGLYIYDYNSLCPKDCSGDFEH